MKTFLIVLLTVALTSPVGAQMVHKCPGPDGKLVYQQTPCAGEAGEVLKIEIGKALETRKATDKEAEDCLSAIKIVYKYKDPDSLRIEGGAYVNVYPSGRKEILFSLNGKNSYGAYAGAKPAKCTYKANGVIDDVQTF